MAIILRFLFFTIISIYSAYAGNIDLPRDVNGWTIFTPSSDSRIIYISATGNDATGAVYSSVSPEVGSDPLQPSGNISAFATYASALTHVRTGYPDWVLFKRGDSFIIKNQGGLYPKPGRSATEPSLLGAYGASGASPIIKHSETPNNTAFAVYAQIAGSLNYVAISGIDFYAHTRDPESLDYTIPTAGSYQYGLWIYQEDTSVSNAGILIEGCKFRFFSNNAISTGAPIDGLTIRRNLFLDNYDYYGTRHSQGLYIWNQSTTLEENVFVHNGWLVPNGSGPGEATMFNHNLYISGARGGSYSRNLFIQGSNAGAKFTAEQASNPSPILIDNNLFIDGQIGIGLGNNTVGLTSPYTNVTIKENLLSNIGRLRQIPSQSVSLGIGVSFDSIGTTVTKNLLINQNNADVTNVTSFSMAGIQTNFSIESNIVYSRKFDNTFSVEGVGDQKSTGSTKTNVVFKNNKIHNQTSAGYLVYAEPTLNGISFSGNKYYSDKSPSDLFRTSGPTYYSFDQWQAATGDNSTFGAISFPDSTRDIAGYMASIGETATIDAFIAKCREQGRYSWDGRFTAEISNNWIKHGYIQSRRLAKISNDIKTINGAIFTLPVQ